MKNTTKKLMAMLMAALFLFSLAACDSKADTTADAPEATSQALSLVVGATSAFPKVSPALFRDQAAACVMNGEVSCFVADGDPEIVLHRAYKAEKMQKAKAKQVMGERSEQLLKDLSRLAADDAEANALGATIKAANTLRSSGADQQTLILYASGLDTAGVMNFTASNLLESDPTAIADQLAALNSIPDLAGMDVIVYGLGQVAGQQQKLDAANIHKLEAIWTAILERGNPASLTFDKQELPGTPPADDLPSVTPVQIVNSTLEGNADLSREIVRFDVHFTADTANFRDPAAAHAAAASMAHQLSDNQVRIMALGTIASAGTGDGIALSEARALAAKTALIEQGIAAERIRAVGLGKTSFSLRTNDLDAEGNLIEDQAALNRAVYLIPQSNPVYCEVEAILAERG